MNKKNRMFIIVFLIVLGILTTSFFSINYAKENSSKELSKDPKYAEVGMTDEDKAKIEADIEKGKAEMEQRDAEVYDNILAGFKPVKDNSNDSIEIKDKKDKKTKLEKDYEKALKKLKDDTDKDKTVKDKDKEALDNIIAEIYALGLDDPTESDRTLIWLGGMYDKVHQAITDYSYIENRTKEQEKTYNNLKKELEEIKKLQDTVKDRQAKGNEDMSDIWSKIENLDVSF